MDTFNPVRVKLLGTTRELLELTLRDSTLSDRPPLVLTNADALLGPLPSPYKFVCQLAGGDGAYETLSAPDRVEATLLNNFDDEKGEPQRVQVKPVKLNEKTARRLSALLTDFDSYVWTVEKLCSPNYGVKLSFIRGTDCVEVRLCFECDILEFSFAGHSASENFDFIHDDLAKVIKTIFPGDPKIKELETKTDHRKDAERMLQNLLRSNTP